MNKPKLHKPIPEEFECEWIDLNQFLKGGSDAAMLLRIHGDSMNDIEIVDGDWVMLDRARQPKEGDLIIKNTDDEYCISIYDVKTQDVFGVITFIIKPLDSRTLTDILDAEVIQ